MQDINNYTINIQDLEESAKKAILSGYETLLIINGEYYEIELKKGEKTA